MKIISPFTDYYDHAIHPSQLDESVRYIRRTSIVPLDYPGSLGELSFKRTNSYQVTHYNSFTRMNDRYHMEICEAVLVVGKLAFHICVPVSLKIDDDLKFHHNTDGLVKPYGAPNTAAYLKLYNQYLVNKGNVDITIEMSERRFWDTQRKVVIKEGLASFDATQLALHYQTPVLLIGEFNSRNGYHNETKIQVMLNPPLRAFNMMSELDTFQAWQEISMWIGGIMPGACSPMVELSNESKIEKAGFDKKISFRTRSSKV